MACIPPLMVTMVCQMVPPLKVWGDSVSSDHISVILLFQTPKALVRFSTIQLLSKSHHLHNCNDIVLTFLLFGIY